MSTKFTAYLFCFLASIGPMVFCLNNSNDTCPDGSPVVSWTQWVCNVTAQTSFRTGSCRGTTTTVTVVQNKRGPVVAWVEWSPWSPSCGGSETVQSRSRLCQVPPDNAPYCSTCGYQNITAIQSRHSTIPPCCEDGSPVVSWSQWVCNETAQTSSRTGSCTDRTTTVVQNKTVELTSWEQWGEWSDHLRPCTECVYQFRQRVCPNATNQDGHPIQSCCVGSSEEFGCYGDTCPDGSPVVSWTLWVCNETTQSSSRIGSCNDAIATTVVQNKTGPVVSWVEWSPWSPSCGVNETVQSRSQLCQVPPDNTPYCSTCGYLNTTATQSRHSTIPPCCEDLEYGPWASWSPGCGELPNCTATTQFRSRTRDCTSHLSCPSCPLDQETRTVSAATVPPVPVYVWPIIVLAPVSAVILLIVVMIAVLCYKHCKKKKKAIYLQLFRERSDSEGIYHSMNILLQPLRPTSTTLSPTDEQQETEFMPHPTLGVSAMIELHPDTSYHSDGDGGPGSTLSDSDEELTLYDKRK